MAAAKMRRSGEENPAVQRKWTEEHFFICIKSSDVYLFALRYLCF
jgi:hypothetical protein